MSALALLRRIPIPWAAATLIAFVCLAAGARASTQLTIHTDQLLGSPFMGLGVEFDPYDTLSPTTIDWPLIEQRLDFMQPGFLRVMVHVADYFDGYDSAGDPVYTWTSPPAEELLAILQYAKAQGIPVVLGNWEDPLVNGDARIPAEFVADLRDTYGLTNIEYYDLENEPNDSTSCDFSCWAAAMKTLAAGFQAAGLTGSVKLIGPDNENSWDDDQPAAAIDVSKGLDADNPIGGDAWVTDTLQSIPSLIGAYDSHRYATIWGIENGIFGDQVRARRLEISNLDSPAKPYFDGEVGLVARTSSPFTSDFARLTPSLRAQLDPSAEQPEISTFVDDQPYITTFAYGTWMGDMMIQGIDAGLSGASAWDLDDAMHNGGGYGSKELKQWGFWNSLAGQDGYPASDIDLRPWFYAWSVLSRAFPSGSQPLLLPSTDVPGLRVSAARIPDGSGYDLSNAPGYDLSLAVVDDSAAPQTITLSVPSVTGTLPMAQYDYFPAAQPVDANGLPVPTQILQTVPAAGITLQLPAGGMVVLTSHGFAAPVQLNQASTSLSDPVDGWQLTAGHTRQLKLFHSDPAEFDDAAARAAPSGRKPGSLTYRAEQLSSFALQAYAAKALGLSAYGSENGAMWWPIPLASTQPAPAVGGHELLDELLPAGPVPAGTNELRLQLGPGTELADVQLAEHRSGPACIPAAGGTTDDSIIGIAPGASGRTVTAAIGAPSASVGRTRRYCVTGGGEVGVVFDHAGVQLLATDAGGYRLAGIGIGTSQRALQRHFGSAALHPDGTGIFATATGIVYVIHSARVFAEGVAAPALVPHERALSTALKLAVG